MKRTIKHFALLLVAALTVGCQLVEAKSEADKQTLAWRYEIDPVGVGVQGTYQIKVWSYSKDPVVATEQSKKNAVHGIIFKGFLPSSDGRIPGQNPLDPEVNAEQAHEDYFKQFFDDGGKYMQFVSLTNAGAIAPGDHLKVGKEYKIGLIVSVNVDALRKQLETDGIIKKLGGELGNSKKPTIMVVPSDRWCNQHGYMMAFSNQGQTVKVPDYKAALQNDPNLLQVISKINEMMAERGFPLKNLETELKSLESEAAEDNMTQSGSGSEIAESPVDALKKVAKADIIMQIDWTLNQMGSDASVNFNFQGLDSYTDKQVAGASGTGQGSFSAPVPVLLQEAVLSYMDQFNSQLQNHFDDMAANGREIKLKIKKWDSFADNLETEVGSDELSTLIEDWVRENTVSGKFNTVDATENMMRMEQVMIPLFDPKKPDRAIDARYWARGLQKYLKTIKTTNAPDGIDCKLMMKGLGEVQIILGEK